MTRPAPPVRLYWWRWRYPHWLNFGDEVTAPLIERLTGRRVVWTPLARCDLIGAGSILQSVVARRAASMPVVWGSGFIRPPAADEPCHDVAALAVRGALSAARLAPERRIGLRFGDPGILANRLVDGRVRAKYALGVVPHYQDVGHPQVRRLAALSRHVRLIDVTWTPEEVAREIASCEAVVSSSMHGLIFADSLGVPNVHLRLGSRVIGGLYKFRDYDSAVRGELPETPPGDAQAAAVPGDARAADPHRVLAAADLDGLDLDGVVRSVTEGFCPARHLPTLRRGLIAALESQI